MPTLFAVYNLKKDSMKPDYDKYLKDTKVPGIRGAPWCSSFHTWKIDQPLAPAHSEPSGPLPDKSPYMYVAKIEVSDLTRCNIHNGTRSRITKSSHLFFHSLNMRIKSSIICFTILVMFISH